MENVDFTHFRGVLTFSHDCVLYMLHFFITHFTIAFGDINKASPDAEESSQENQRSGSPFSVSDDLSSTLKGN